ncbi:hypothetical protein [Emticicia sp. SJ17W-69]
MKKREKFVKILFAVEMSKETEKLTAMELKNRLALTHFQRSQAR